METNLYNAAGITRKHSLDLISLSSGGRVIYRRTRWSPSLCNAVAALAGIGSER